MKQVSRSFARVLLLAFCAVISLPVTDGTRFLSTVDSFDLNSATASLQSGDVNRRRPLLKTQKLGDLFPRNNASTAARVAAANSNSSSLMVFAVLAAIGLAVIFSRGSMAAHLLVALATVGTAIEKSTKGEDKIVQVLQDWDAPKPNKDDDTALSLYKRSKHVSRSKSGQQKSRQLQPNARTPPQTPANTGRNDDADYQTFLAKLDAELDFATVPSHQEQRSRGRKPACATLSGLSKVGGGYGPDQAGFYYDDWEEEIFNWEAVPRAPPAAHKKPMEGELVGVPPERQLCLPKPQVAPSMYIKDGHPRSRSFFGDERFFSQQWATGVKQLPLPPR